MKFLYCYSPLTENKSLPVRGAWVEIMRNMEQESGEAGRSPCGERGLKSASHSEMASRITVAPRAGSVG